MKVKFFTMMIILLICSKILKNVGVPVDTKDLEMFNYLKVRFKDKQSPFFVHTITEKFMTSSKYKKTCKRDKKAENSEW